MLENLGNREFSSLHKCLITSSPVHRTEKSWDFFRMLGWMISRLSRPNPSIRKKSQLSLQSVHR